MNMELQDLLGQQEAAQQRLAEISAGLLEVEYLRKHAPQQIHDLKKKLAGLLADSFLGQAGQTDIKEIIHEIVHIEHITQLTDDITKVLEQRIEEIRSVTGLNGISSQINHLSASEKYKVLRDDIIKNGKLPPRGLETFKRTAKKARQSQEASRLIEALKKRAERNNYRRKFTFNCDD